MRTGPLFRSDDGAFRRRSPAARRRQWMRQRTFDVPSRLELIGYAR